MSYNNWQQSEKHLPKVFKRLGRSTPHNSAGTDHSSSTAAPVDRGFKIAGHYQNNTGVQYANHHYHYYNHAASHSIPTGPAAHAIPTGPAAQRHHHRHLSSEAHHRTHYIKHMHQQDAMPNRDYYSPTPIMSPTTSQHSAYHGNTPTNSKRISTENVDYHGNTTDNNLPVSPVSSAPSSPGFSFVKNNDVTKEPSQQPGRSSFSFVRSNASTPYPPSSPYYLEPVHQMSPASVTPVIPTGPASSTYPPMEVAVPKKKSASPEKKTQDNEKDNRQAENDTSVMNERDRLAKNIQITVSRPSLAVESNTEKNVQPQNTTSATTTLDQDATNSTMFQPINRKVIVKGAENKVNPSTRSPPPCATEKTQRSRSPPRSRKRHRSTSPGSSSDEEKAPFPRGKADHYVPNYNKRPLPAQFRQERNRKKVPANNSDKKSHEVTPGTNPVSLSKTTSKGKQGTHEPSTPSQPKPLNTSPIHNKPSQNQPKEAEKTTVPSLKKQNKLGSDASSMAHRIITMSNTIVKPIPNTNQKVETTEPKLKTEPVNAGTASLNALSNKPASARSAQPTFTLQQKKTEEEATKTSQNAVRSDAVASEGVSGKSTSSDNNPVLKQTTALPVVNHALVKDNTNGAERKRPRVFSDNPSVDVPIKDSPVKKHKSDEVAKPKELQQDTTLFSSQTETTKENQLLSSFKAPNLNQLRAAALEKRQERERQHQLRLRQLDIDDRDDIVMDVTPSSDTSFGPSEQQQAAPSKKKNPEEAHHDKDIPMTTPLKENEAKKGQPQAAGNAIHSSDRKHENDETRKQEATVVQCENKEAPVNEKMQTPNNNDVSAPSHIHSDAAVMNPQLLSPPMEKAIPSFKEPTHSSLTTTTTTATPTQTTSSRRVPRPWKVVMDDEGAIFYLNVRTGERTNVRPE
ncbi:hypothetical protein EDC96DRAFT_573213 [Choanephora cucurbitarum]|nr:hypothetical protein EDC96DRAFT_573213 [Choanephora cucurbitarum]